MEKIKTVIKKLLICVIILLIALVVDYFVQDCIYKNVCTLVEDDFTHVFQIDSTEIKDNRFILKGWVFKLGEDSAKDDFDIILYDYNDDKEYYMDVKDVVREDVNEYFRCEYNYSDVGFVADIRISNLDLNASNYEVLIRPKDKMLHKAYKSGIYISGGKMMFVKPEDYVPLDVEGTELEKIVEDGALRVYRPDVGMYVYQYEGKFYWITDRKYIFETDCSTCVECQLDTTQIYRLPQHRLENGHYWDNIGFVYENYETEGTDIYRIAITDMPVSYSIEKIWVGYYVEGWQWIQEFRPRYKFY